MSTKTHKYSPIFTCANLSPPPIQKKKKVGLFLAPEDVGGGIAALEAATCNEDQKNVSAESAFTVEEAEKRLMFLNL